MSEAYAILAYNPTFEYFVDYVQEGDTILIRVSKSWYYKRRLFVSGEINMFAAQKENSDAPVRR